MPWWAWIIFGVVLLGAELALVDAEFYLVFLGVSALVTGFVALRGVPLPPWGEWLLFAALAVTTMVLFRQRLNQWLRPPAKGYESMPEGQTLRVPERLEPGATCRAEFRGTTWNVVNAGEEALEAGETARIERAENLTLMVTKGR